MSKVIMECPVCGSKNEREYYAEDVGTVEDYYFCKKCGYSYIMNYAPPVEVIYMQTGFKILPQLITLVKHIKKAKKYKIVGGGHIL